MCEGRGAAAPPPGRAASLAEMRGLGLVGSYANLEEVRAVPLPRERRALVRADGALGLAVALVADERDGDALVRALADLLEPAARRRARARG